MTPEIPLMEFDETRRAMIEPRPLTLDVLLPDRAVICFFPEVMDQLCEAGTADVIGEFSPDTGGGLILHVPDGGEPVCVFFPGVGAPLAAHRLERVIATGCSKFVACGGAGVLIPGLAVGHVLVATAAVRDEGTSYHYLPPGAEVPLDAAATAACAAVLDERGVPYVLAKTWTTDAPFRETPGRVRRRRDQGCATVEMETAALAAVALFRRLPFAQYLYAGDDLSTETWDHRQWNTHSARTELVSFAIEAVRRI